MEYVKFKRLRIIKQRIERQREKWREKEREIDIETIVDKSYQKKLKNLQMSNLEDKRAQRWQNNCPNI